MIESFFGENLNYDEDSKSNSVEGLIYNSQVMSRVSGQSLYIMDCRHLKFLYVSDNPLFLCGYRPRDVVRMSFLFYKKVAHPEDLDRIMNISIEALSVYTKYTREECTRMVMSYDFRIINPFTHQTVMINHSFIPAYFTPEGFISEGICLVRPSTQSDSGNALIKQNGITPLYEYSAGKGWMPIANYKTITITDREKQILRITIQGYNNIEISEILSIDINTVKAHKKNIFKKLKVNNIAEAIVYASNNNLL